MRLLIAKLASAAAHSVSVAMNSEHDIADVATDLDSCVRLLRRGDYDLAMVIMGQGRMRARDAIARMRREAGAVPMVVLTELSASEAGAPDDGRGSDGRWGLEDAAHHPGVERDAADSANEAADVDWAAVEANGYATTPARTGPTRTGPTRTEPASGDQAVALSVEPDTETVRLGGHPLPLSQAEYRIFAALWERRGDIIPANDLLEAVYRDDPRPASRVLPVFLFKLRRKLRSAGVGDLIETAVGRGFTIRTVPLAMP